MGTKMGTFHNMSEEMRPSLLVLTREDSSATREYDTCALSRQRAEKSRKEDLIKNNVINEQVKIHRCIILS